MASTFVDALTGAGRPVVMELKPRSAGGEDLFRGRTPAEIVARYEAAGAPCLSVVTGRWFGGDASLLAKVARSTDLPILQKDFITNAGQLQVAKDLGASAVLLTATLLPRVALERLTERALALNLTPFIEVAGDDEVEALPRCEGCVVAVNNKDIRLRERGDADMDRSRKLLPAVLGTGTSCPVSASGIDDPWVAADLLSAGYAGLLVGTHLLRADRLESWCEDLDALRRPAARGTR
ncbi:indole-3-glycerol-phosphate synthase [Micromonospora sp. KC213]|uniref:indole-3-glycerol-phosphate synthase n=1 Tax=Micromonospora sp. KC213 TaxID=2530378 RepID=UPI001049C060|nr:indole-3-glycerol-phosphate synthase [Micromonospora sp. KC213]TDC43481.1 indole-3-glycerol-phosphate synthase [Micromonospora sp. KC213]